MKLNSSLWRAQKEVQLCAPLPESWVIHPHWKSTRYKSEISSYPSQQLSGVHHTGLQQPCHPAASVQRDLAARRTRWALQATPVPFLQRQGTHSMLSPNPTSTVLFSGEKKKELFAGGPPSWQKTFRGFSTGETPRTQNFS